MEVELPFHLSINLRGSRRTAPAKVRKWFLPQGSSQEIMTFWSLTHVNAENARFFDIQVPEFREICIIARQIVQEFSQRFGIEFPSWFNGILPTPFPDTSVRSHVIFLTSFTRLTCVVLPWTWFLVFTSDWLWWTLTIRPLFRTTFVSGGEACSESR